MVKESGWITKLDFIVLVATALKINDMIADGKSKNDILQFFIEQETEFDEKDNQKYIDKAEGIVDIMNLKAREE